VTNIEELSAVGPVTYHLDKVLDAHTHPTGSQSGESTENILECLNACGIEKAFIFAPELDVQTRALFTQIDRPVGNHSGQTSPKRPYD
jgi:hypothetical protein